MTTKLSGKVALITGASAGIGQACARALAEEGARGQQLGYVGARRRGWRGFVGLQTIPGLADY